MDDQAAVAPAVFADEDAVMQRDSGRSGEGVTQQPGRRPQERMAEGGHFGDAKKPDAIRRLHANGSGIGELLGIERIAVFQRFRLPDSHPLHSQWEKEREQRSEMPGTLDHDAWQNRDRLTFHQRAA